MMQLERFRVTNYRNVVDSGWVEVNRVTGLVGQNESGKSNLCEALYLLNPFEAQATYKLNEDWPADNWGGRDQNGVVCEGEFMLTTEEIKSLFDYERKTIPDELSAPPAEMRLTISRRYNGNREFRLTNYVGKLDQAQIGAWALPLVPKCVYIREYDMSGTTTELDQLAQRLAQRGWNGLANEDQTILIILQLANIDINDFLQKGQSPEGRTLRAFDKRQASAYLTQQFAKLWKQKEVRFDIEIDATTLNIFVEDIGLGMPVRLSRRSTGFRWYVSFAWKFTHATKGDYKNCILLLEEPGIHLHHAGHRDLLELFERLAADNNTVIYTTHLSTMLDQGYPERIRIVEVRDHHSRVINGMVSDQKKPMMVIEARLGLTGEMSGLLGNRQTLIVEAEMTH
ncbi:MAG: AAA family ATPase [Candidatus Sulfotelmatobacter sp.]